MPEHTEENVTQEMQETDHRQKDKDLSSLFFNSYKFSQGSENLQLLIFRWLVGSGYIKEGDTTDSLKDSLARIKMPTKHLSTSSDTIVSSENPEYPVLSSFMSATVRYEVFSPGESAKEENMLLTKLLNEMLDRDVQYQLKERPNRTKKSWKTDSDDDPHASFIRRFLLSGDNPGHLAYRDLFSKMKVILDQSSEDEKLNAKITRLASSWEENHSEETFFPQQLEEIA